MDIKNHAKLISLSSKNRVLQSKTKCYLRRISKLVNREQEQRRRIEHLVRSLAAMTNKVRMQASTLCRKDLKVAEHNREICALREFMATLETMFPNIKENVRTIQKSLGDIDVDDKTNTATGDNLGQKI
jgi:predicted RNase H-like nuclease (RuvC/YqgF family)